MIIEPQDRTARSNMAEHDQMIEAINANDALANEAKSDSATALATANEAKTEVATAQQTADDAKTLATTADGKATANAVNINTNTADIGTLNGLMDFMNANAFITVVFSKTATAITAVFSRKDGSTYSANLPIATTTTAGFMDSAMKQQLDANTNAIVVLQSQYPTIFVSFPNASPTQAEIQTVYDNYRTAYPAINLPAIPAQGFTMIDTVNNISVEWDNVTSTWFFSTNNISKATNTTYGVLVGEENGAPGSLYIVAGKALVNGFDALKGRMDDAESAIALKAATLNVTKESTGKVILDLKRTDGTINSKVVLNSVTDESVGANEGCLITKGEYAKAKADSIATTKPAYVVGVDALDGVAKLYPFLDEVKGENVNIIANGVYNYQLISDYSGTPELTFTYEDYYPPGQVGVCTVSDNENKPYIMVMDALTLLTNTSQTHSVALNSLGTLVITPNAEPLLLKDGYYEGTLGGSPSNFEKGTFKNTNCNFRITSGLASNISLKIGSIFRNTTFPPNINDSKYLFYINRLSD